MLRKPHATWAALAALGVLLLAGFAFVLEKRMSEGGVYPHYASFRSDPLGTSALYETLERMEGRQVRRNTAHLGRIPGLDRDTSLLLLGFPRTGLETLRAHEDSPVLRAVSEGARLVITFNPGLVPEHHQPVLSEEEQDWFERRRALREKRERPAQADETGAAEDAGHETGDESDSTAEERALERSLAEALGPRLDRELGFRLASRDDLRHTAEGWQTEPGETVSAEAVPDDLPDWHSFQYFETSDPAWRHAVLLEGRPVVIERAYGEGTVVVASDSYFVSNEALHFDERPGFLVWLAGDKRSVVFDETIHGSRETGGAVKLMRRYRIHGVLFGLLFFAALWAWRSASPLAPGSEEVDLGLDGGAVAGEQADSGFIRLLRRSVPRAALLEQCWETWRSSQSRPLPAERLRAAEAALARHRENPGRHGPAETYEEIAEALRRR